MTVLSPGAPVALLEELVALRRAVDEEARETVARWRPWLRRARWAPSAANLAAYLALRRRDLRAIQSALMPLGLSSLGRCEARVLPNLDAVISALDAVAGREGLPAPSARAFFRGERLLRAHTAAIFGPPPAGRDVRVMVTLPTEAADDPQLVPRLIAAGMDCARINCAHDDPEIWRAMIARIRFAELALGRSCRIHADLAGPKLRTGEVRSRGERIREGDELLVADRLRRKDERFAAAFTCVPSLRGRLRPGDPLWIDDGKIGTCVTRLEDGEAIVRVLHVPEKGGKLKSGKGINVPESDVGLPSLSAKDRDDLAFLAGRVDAIAYSFVRTPDDVEALHEALDEHAARDVAITLKIETAQAVENLPELIACAAGRRPTAVMIARGDLAIEIGYQRLAEMQEELLWLCEAAHVPVVWATQVLDTLVREGMASRAEFTDAAMAERADCVMLNKGKHVIEGLQALVDVLARMEGHQTKKTSRLRALRSWASAAERGRDQRPNGPKGVRNGKSLAGEGARDAERGDLPAPGQPL